MTSTPTRRTRARYRSTTALVLVGLALITGCSSGPSQEQRIADAITAYDTVTTLAVEADTRVHEVFPDLDLTTDTTELDYGNWTACTDDPYENTYDSPDGSEWLSGNAYTLNPRQPADDLIEPLAQAYIDDGWTLSHDYLDDKIPEIVLRKDGYYLDISGLTQDHLDQIPDVGALFTIDFSSICLYSPDNLTEWDPTDPHNFDLARRTDQ